MKMTEKKWKEKEKYEREREKERFKVKEKGLEKIMTGKENIITFISHGLISNNKKNMCIISNQMNELSKFNLKVLGFNSQKFQVPSEPLNRVATVWLAFESKSKEKRGKSMV